MQPFEIEKFRKAAQTGKLSTRDRAFLNSLVMDQASITRDNMQDMTPTNRAELASAISSAPSPDIRALLEQEQARITDMINGLNSSDLAKQSTKDNTDPSPSFSVFRMISEAIQNLWSK